MLVDEFDFDLPEERIALRPAPGRDQARLLYVPASGGVQDKMIYDLPSLLRPGDVLVLNDTCVIPAALDGTRQPVGPMAAADGRFNSPGGTAARRSWGTPGQASGADGSKPGG